MIHKTLSNGHRGPGKGVDGNLYDGEHAENRTWLCDGAD